MSTPPFISFILDWSVIYSDCIYAKLSVTYFNSLTESYLKSVIFYSFSLRI